MSTKKGGHEQATLDPATDAEEQQVRDEFGIVVIREKRSGQGRHLHIPDAETSGSDDPDEPRPLCGGKSTTSFITKSEKVYPPGFHPVCMDCITAWRDDNE